MRREIEFLFDFGGPNSWFVHRAIPAIEAAGKAKFRYVPVLLGGLFKATGNKPPMMTYGHVTAKVNYDRLEMDRFRARHGITEGDCLQMIIQRGPIPCEVDRSARGHVYSINFVQLYPMDDIEITLPI